MTDRHKDQEVVEKIYARNRQHVFQETFAVFLANIVIVKN